MYTLDPVALLAVLPATSNEASRPSLNGLHLRADGVAVATDGHILAMHRAAHTCPVALTLGNPKALTAFLKAAVRRGKTGRNPPPNPVTVTATHDGLASIADTASSITIPLVENFPAEGIVRVFPSEGREVPRLRLDTALLARFPGCLVFSFSGEERAVTLTNPENADWLGLVMPVRINNGLGADPYACPWLAHDMSPNGGKEDTPAEDAA